MVQRPPYAAPPWPRARRAVRDRAGCGGVHQRAAFGVRLAALVHPQHGFFRRHGRKGPGAARRLCARGRSAGAARTSRRERFLAAAHHVCPGLPAAGQLVSAHRYRPAPGPVVPQVAHPGRPGKDGRALAGPDPGAVHRDLDGAAGARARHDLRRPAEARAHPQHGRVPCRGDPGSGRSGAGRGRTGRPDRHRHLPGIHGSARPGRPHRPHLQAQDLAAGDRGSGPEAAPGARAAIALGRPGQRHRHDPGLPAEPVRIEFRIAVCGDVPRLQPGGFKCRLPAPGAGHPARGRGLTAPAVQPVSRGGGALRAVRLAAGDPVELAAGEVPPALGEPDHLHPVRAGAGGGTGAQPLGDPCQLRGDPFHFHRGRLSAGAGGDGGIPQGGHGNRPDRCAAPALGAQAGRVGGGVHPGLRAAVADARCRRGAAPGLPGDPAALRGLFPAGAVDAGGGGPGPVPGAAAVGRDAGLPGRPLPARQRRPHFHFGGGADHGRGPLHRPGHHDPQLPADGRALGPADRQRGPVCHHQDGSGQPVSGSPSPSRSWPGSSSWTSMRIVSPAGVSR